MLRPSIVLRSAAAVAVLGVSLAGRAQDDVLPFLDEAPLSTPGEEPQSNAAPALATPAPEQAAEPHAEAPAKPPADESGGAPQAHASVPSAKPAEEGPAPTKAEQITRLRQTVEADQTRLSELKAGLTNPNSEFVQAEAEFREADRVLQLGKKRIAELTEKKLTAEVDALKQPFAEAEATWKLARERFDNAIQQRETEQARIGVLEQKIKHDTEALDRLTTESPAAPAAAPTVVTTAATAPAPVAEPAASGPTVAGMAATAAGLPPAAAPAAEGAPAEGAATPAPATPAEGAKKPSKELAHAQVQAAEKNREADEAEREAASVGERLQMLDKNIELQQKLVAGARKRRDLANEQRKLLEKEYRTKSIGGAPRAELESLEEKIASAEDRFDAGVEEVREGAETLDEMQSERAVLQTQEMAAMRTASEKRREAEDAQSKVKTLQNPFTPRNVLQWCIDHGPKLLAILVGMLLLQVVSKVFSRRIVMILARGGARGSREEREDRARTLVGVFHNAASLVIIVGSILMACEEIGIAIGPLMGGAAVFGLAVAFGAQNLIRDYFYGFMILLENQYKLNDVVKIGDTSGQVERITLRVTVLRDLEGRVHFVPNGKIDAVTNMTHGWSRALFEIGIAYKEDADQVMGVLLDLAAELRRDPQYAPLILDDAEMLGVDSFGDSAVNLKFIIKTRPLKQWTVKRELLRRIKRRFDELGIEIPFPHRTVYHHSADATQSAPQRDQDADGWAMRQAG